MVKFYGFSAKLVSVLLSFSLLVQAGGDLLITGQVVASNSQLFIAPRTDNWQQQIKWMAPEGSIVKVGDMVVAFDNSTLLSDIQRREVELTQAEQKAKEDLMKLQQELIDAEHKFTQAELLVKKAQIDANVPTTYLSQFQGEQNQFELSRQQRLLEQAKMTLQNKRATLVAEKKKQQLEVRRIKQELQRRQDDAKKMEMFANRSGPVLHGTHPWDDRKLKAGMSVQQGWVVAELPSADKLEVQAFLNEVDLPRLNRQQEVELLFDISPTQRVKGRITRVGLQADKKEQWSDSRYVEVRVQLLDVAPLSLTPGMSVLVIAAVQS